MDMISQFSDDLLIQILSLVPTKQALATSCLSKRWQLVWSLVPKLEYDDSNDHSDDDYKSFTQFVYRSLMSNKAPVLESLDLKLGPKCQAVDIGIWIGTAVARRVHELIVDISSSKKGSISLPSSLGLCTCETLETLRLYGCIRLDIPLSVRLSSLKILHLRKVDYADKGSLPRLLSGCPRLEHLDVYQDSQDDVAIVVPTLQRLKIVNDGIEYKGNGFVVDAPSLVYLNIVDDVHYDFHRIEYMPKLEDANVDMTQGSVNHKFLKAFTCVRWLYLCLSISEVLPPSGTLFHHLVSLELNTCAQGWWDLLTHMLQGSPILEFLKLNDEHDLDGFTSKETPECWKQPSSAPKCFLYSLEAFEWKGYKGRRGDREMATYVLANTSRLESAIFSPESVDAGERYRMVQDLASVATPSPCFKLFLG